MAIAGDQKYTKNANVGGNVVAILLRQKEIRQRQDAGTISGVQNPRPFIAGVPVTTRMQEVTSYSAEVTKHATESGVILSDHVILQPIMLDLSFDVTNIDVNYAKQAQELLEKLFFTRTPIDLQTEHKQLSNMVMTSLNIDNSAPQWGRLDFLASFQQLNFVTIEGVSVSSTKVNPENQTGRTSTSR